jgi:hypothetical protein
MLIGVAAVVVTAMIVSALVAVVVDTVHQAVIDNCRRAYARQLRAGTSVLGALTRHIRKPSLLRDPAFG